MKMAAVSIVLLLFVLAADVASAQTPAMTPTAAMPTTSPAPTSTPMRPTPTLATRPPVGDFTVVPSSGPVGTAVTVSGDFDEDITGVRFQCFYHDTFDEGLVLAYSLPQPSPSFSFQFQIPANLTLRQRGGETRPTLVGQCEFLAMAGHQLLTASVPFTVTSGQETVLPQTGSGASARDARWPMMLPLVLASLGVIGVWVGYRRGLSPSPRSAVLDGTSPLPYTTPDN